MGNSQPSPDGEDQPSTSSPDDNSSDDGTGTADQDDWSSDAKTYFIRAVIAGAVLIAVTGFGGKYILEAAIGSQAGDTGNDGVGWSVIGVFLLFQAVPSVLIFAYGWWAKPKRENRSHEQMIVYGNSLYYLGFTYTLLSLVVMYLAFTRMGISNYEVVVLQGGVALISTVVGLVGKIWVSHFSLSENYELEDAKSSLAKELRLIQTNLSHLRISLPEAVKKFNDQMDQTVQKTTEAVGETYQAPFHEVAKELNKAAQVLRNASDSIERSSTKHSDETASDDSSSGSS
jgi:hypothetical protein